MDFPAVGMILKTSPERWAERKPQVQLIFGHCEALLAFVSSLEPWLFLCQPEENMETCSFHISPPVMVRHREPSSSSTFWEPSSIRRVREVSIRHCCRGAPSSFISLLSLVPGQGHVEGWQDPVAFKSSPNPQKAWPAMWCVPCFSDPQDSSFPHRKCLFLNTKLQMHT